jgi:hypothetical protein
VATPIKNDVVFGPPADTATLSEANLRTFHALFRQPAGYKLKRANVIRLLKTLGIDDAHHRVRKLKAKDITGDEVLEFRQILARAGFSPGTSAQTGPAENASRKQSAVVARAPHSGAVSTDSASHSRCSVPRHVTLTSTADRAP